MNAPASPQPKDTLTDGGLSTGGGRPGSANSPALVWQPGDGSEYCPLNGVPESSEVDWLSEFDPCLIDSLRGVVNFVD